MIQRLLPLMVAILMSSCACSWVHITKTDIAAGATNPRTIYIRPFAIKYASFVGNHGASGEAAIRKSLAPTEFANMLQEELCKLAPAMVIDHCERPEVGWLVEGEFDLVDAGNPGYSKVVMHVRVIEIDGECPSVGSKDSEKIASHKSGRIIYEFDLKGGSFSNVGSIYSPGLGYAPPFDLRNAAERILMELSPDPHRYGYRSSPTIRY